MFNVYRTHKIVAPVEIVSENGAHRIHKAGCKHITRLQRSHGKVWTDARIGQTLADYAEETFGDISSDRHEVGSDAWSDACWGEWIADLSVSPCAEECLTLEPPAPRPLPAPEPVSAPVSAPGASFGNETAARRADTRARILARLDGMTVREASYLLSLTHDELSAMLFEM